MSADEKKTIEAYRPPTDGGLRKAFRPTGDGDDPPPGPINVGGGPIVKPTSETPSQPTSQPTSDPPSEPKNTGPKKD